MATTEESVDHCTAGPHDGIQTTVAELVEDDLVVVNETRRTWTVTDIMDQPDRDDAVHRRVVRLRSAPENHDPDVAGLISTVREDVHECRLEILHTEHWYREGHTASVEEIEILETTPSWVVVPRSGDGIVYHLPDPVAACRGEARPACHDTAAGQSDSKSRFVARHLIQTAERPCKECFRRHRPRICERVRCPDCDRIIAVPYFQGEHAECVREIGVECPDSDCDFSDSVSLNTHLQSDANTY